MTSTQDRGACQARGGAGDRDGGGDRRGAVRGDHDLADVADDLAVAIAALLHAEHQGDALATARRRREVARLQAEYLGHDHGDGAA